MKTLKRLLTLILAMTALTSFARDGGDVGGGGDLLELKVEKTLSEVSLDLLENRDFLAQIYQLDAVRLSVVAKKVMVINVKESDLKKAEYGENFFVMDRKGSKRTVYAKNYHLPRPVIFLNGMLWEKLTDKIEFEYLVFHELLGAAGVEVNAYKLGNSIFAELLKRRGDSQRNLSKVLKKTGDLFSSKAVKELEEKYLKIRTNEAEFRLEMDAVIYIIEKRIQALNKEVEKIDRELKILEIKKHALEGCVAKLNIEESIAYGFGEADAKSTIEANAKVENCLEDAVAKELQ